MYYYVLLCMYVLFMYYLCIIFMYYLCIKAHRAGDPLCSCQIRSAFEIENNPGRPNEFIQHIKGTPEEPVGQKRNGKTSNFLIYYYFHFRNLRSAVEGIFHDNDVQARDFFKRINLECFLCVSTLTVQPVKPTR